MTKASLFQQNFTNILFLALCFISESGCKSFPPPSDEYFGDYIAYNTEKGLYQIGTILTIDQKTGKIGNPIITLEQDSFEHLITSEPVTKMEVSVNKSFSDKFIGSLYSSLKLETDYSKKTNFSFNIKKASRTFFKSTAAILDLIANNVTHLERLKRHQRLYEIDTFYVVSEVLTFMEAELKITQGKEINVKSEGKIPETELSNSLNTKSNGAIIKSFDQDNGPIHVAINVIPIPSTEIKNWRTLKYFSDERERNDDLEFRTVELKIYSNHQMRIKGKIKNYANDTRKIWIKGELLNEKKEPIHTFSTPFIRVLGVPLQNQDKPFVEQTFIEELGNIDFDKLNAVTDFRFSWYEKK